MRDLVPALAGMKDSACSRAVLVEFWGGSIGLLCGSAADSSTDCSGDGELCMFRCESYRLPAKIQYRREFAHSASIVPAQF